MNSKLITTRLCGEGLSLSNYELVAHSDGLRYKLQVLFYYCSDRAEALLFKYRKNPLKTYCLLQAVEFKYTSRDFVRFTKCGTFFEVVKLVQELRGI